MNQFVEVFFDEAAEHIATVENLLLSVDARAPSDEDLNAIFRAAHSIKGGAGTFGFTHIAELTHALESLLDRLRKHELELTSDMVDAALGACDAIKARLAEHRGQGQADPAQERTLSEQLTALAQGQSAPPAAKAARVVKQQRFGIEFDAAAMQGELDNLLAELREVGELTALPSSSGRKKGRRAAGVRLELVTSLAEQDVRDLLAFVIAPEALTLKILSVEAPAADQGWGLFEEPPADPGYGFFDPVAPSATRAAEVAAPAAVQPSSTPIPSVAARDASSAANASIRVSVDKVDQLINLVGELVITQAMLAQTSQRTDSLLDEAMAQALGQLERNTRDLQEAVMSIRMLPIAFVFGRFPRMVRDLAAKLGKQVELLTTGEGTELDKGIIEKISDPLLHLVRNAVDHGIEAPAQRIAAGKPSSGTITLRAFHQGGNIVIEVRDDGAGLHRDKILAKARERGMTVHDAMSDEDVWALIFEPGFSTAAVLTDVSGRGVGMDVVLRNIKSMSGRVSVASQAGAGTTVTIRLPLTLAILDGISVRVGGELFIIPLTYIVESLSPAQAQIGSMQPKGQVVRVRGDYLPVLESEAMLGVRAAAARPGEAILVIVEADGHRAALPVDELVGQHQVVIKSLETNYRRVPGVSGATIMGDGRVAMILDVPAIVGTVSHPLPQAA